MPIAWNIKVRSLEKLGGPRRTESCRATLSGEKRDHYLSQYYIYCNLFSECYN